MTLCYLLILRRLGAVEGQVSVAVADDIANVLQQVGRIFTVSGFFGVRVQCPGLEGITFAVPVTPYQGRFTPGPARLTGSVFGCVFDPDVGCAKTFHRQLDTTIRLAPAT